ncbi:uncharacterized protein PHALS_01013 [Plasmopara halstedii]|uniref:Uncharacterized protein n=1 Tax=Plasmopara halstedii TaxID=4781 RepID=A0A0P1AUL5_PLAHL|nr:uncharacterized protein PHALS_01013 [Plasmopara halstedii]CEG44666.1 hypothetical protein PHALS_01013 [Plasmopara halstedii]|eukprot:XP_024581035.1 hypothetical protein PHALS_01013 [Plasmopara halstedii]
MSRSRRTAVPRETSSWFIPPQTLCLREGETNESDWDQTQNYSLQYMRLLTSSC